VPAGASPAPPVTTGPHPAGRVAPPVSAAGGGRDPARAGRGPAERGALPAPRRGRIPAEVLARLRPASTLPRPPRPAPTGNGAEGRG
jgi:hypothetical protein